ncbi:MAG TPA: hypothetical protein VFT22_17265 [Kofleriaceae bacterium]|nr:hypothetical protein [Kofleriaceae bacterium]
MNKPLRVVIGLSLVVAAAVGLGRLARRGEPDATDASGRRLLADRVWIDRVPRNERDTIHVFAAISQHSVGAFQAMSAWRGSYEGFRFEAGGGELRLVYPQTGERESVRFTARRCKEQRMDFCLELEGASRGVKRYFSKEGWEIRDRDLDARGSQPGALEGVKQRIESIRAQLAAE